MFIVKRSKASSLPGSTALDGVVSGAVVKSSAVVGICS